MKITDELKKNLENAQSKEEADAILTDAVKGAEDTGVEISDEDLDQISGGSEGQQMPAWRPGDPIPGATA